MTTELVQMQPSRRHTRSASAGRIPRSTRLHNNNNNNNYNSGGGGSSNCASPSSSMTKSAIAASAITSTSATTMTQSLTRPSSNRPTSASRRRFINNYSQSVFRQRTKSDDNSELSAEIIIGARKTGKLCLASKGLAAVPDKVWTINELTEQELRDLQVDLRNADSSTKWWEYEALKSLDLSSNSLTKLSPDIKYLCDLVNLDLHDNLLECIPEEIGSLTKLRKLNISSNKLKHLSADFFKLAELRCLDLKCNLIKELNSAVGDLVMLEYLNLSSNGLTSLPAGLGYLVRLIALDLNHNQLKELPPDIMSMRALKKLDVRNNCLEIVHPLGELGKIERLDFRWNCLRTFPDLRGCTSLQELHLSHNGIREIDVNSLESLGQLKIMNLSNNEIDSIPEEIIMLINVELLDLSYNDISEIPNCIGVMPNLQNFIIDGNRVKNVRRDIVQCGTPRIKNHLRQTINPTNDETANSPLRTCHPNTYPDKYAMRNAKLLSLVGQNVVEVPEEVLENAREAEVTCIDLSRNKLQELTEGLGKIVTATDLKLSYNLLQEVPDWLGDSLLRLKHLDLSKNLLKTLPDSFSLLQQLVELNISFNKFEELPECIYQLVNLEILTANDNKMSAINATSLGNLRRLANLDLSNNNIGYVPPELGNLKNLRNLSLNGNCFKQPRQATLMKGTEEILAYLRNRIPVSRS